MARPFRRALILLALLAGALLPDVRKASIAAGPASEQSIVGAAEPLLWQTFIVNGVLTSSAPQPPTPEASSLALDPPPSGSTVVNFDDAPAPCLFGDTVALRNRYAALGILFSGPGALDGGAVVNQCGVFGVSGHSSPSFLGFNTSASLADGGLARGPETITFSRLVNFVQINGGSSSAGTITLTAFNQGGTPIASASRSGTPTLQTLTVAATDIARVVISFTGSLAVLDDLAFIVSPDRDGDGLTDDREAGLGTDPDDPDTDDDLLRDGFEVDHGFDPLTPGEAGQDPDGDGLSNLAEQEAATDPHDADSDGDGLGDGDEVTRRTLPLDADTDNDGLTDGEEVQVHGTDPLRADTDGGGSNDGSEVNRDHTNPLDPADDRQPLLAMVMDNESDRAIVFNPVNDTVISSVALGGDTPAIGDCVVSADGALGFATDFNSRLWAVDLAAQPPGLAGSPNPFAISNPGEDIALSADGRFLVVCDGIAPAPISVVDTATRAQSTFSVGSNCVAVDVCDDGSVLVGTEVGAVHRLRLNSSGRLSDTGEVLTIHNVQNVYCAPGSRSGLVLSSGNILKSFLVPGLTPVQARTLPGGNLIAAALTADGDRVFARLAAGSVAAFDYDPVTGALGATPVFTLQGTGSPYPFYGIDQIAVHPSNGKLYVGGPNIVRIFDARTGTLLGSITHPDIRQPTGICFRASRDRDGDGLRDEDEAALGTNPGNPDTDGDGLLDGFEFRNGFDPLVPGDQARDPDGDGLDNLGEQGARSDPRDPDSDDDGLGDGQEVTLGTSPIDPDTDDDGRLDASDNCPGVANPGQQDVIHPNGIGDACDDPDGDSIFDATDNCPGDSNAGQANADGDALGDVCDPCPADAQNDADLDGHCANVDNCPAAANPGQADEDGDRVGDACDSCPAFANPAQDEEAACIAVTEDGGLCLETRIDLVPEDFGGSLTILTDQSVPADALRFEVLDTACAEGDIFVFTLNGFLLGNLSADPGLSCGCSPEVQTFSVTDKVFLAAHWKVGGDNAIVIQKIGNAAAVAWVRLVVEKLGDTASSCLLDIEGGGCDEMDLCAAQFEFGPLVEAITLVDPLVGSALVTEVPIEGGRLPEQVDLSGLRDGPAFLCVRKSPTGQSPVEDCQPFTKHGERLAAINGAACGQAPTAVITPGSTQIECESAAGAVVTLDGSTSFDPDSSSGTNDDIVAYRWFEDFGLPSQRVVGEGATLQALLPLGAHALTLEVTDKAALTGTVGATRTVVDTVPPVVSSFLSPGALWPPNHNMVAVHASVSAVDRCGAPTVVLSAITSDEADDAAGGGDGATVGDIQEAGLGLPDDQFLLRAERSSAGDGRTYEVVYRAADGAGNVATATSSVRVPLNQSGVADPVKLTTQQTAQGTLLRWDPVPGALFYNAIRGQVTNIRELSQTIDLGPVVCLESRSTDASTGQFEDGAVPAVGTAFFYLVEYDDGLLQSTYGEESVSKPRVVGSGDCN